MQANLEMLMTEATKKSKDSAEEQAIIDKFSRDAEVRRALKLSSWGNYLKINSAYMKARYGKYALAGTVFALTGAYVGALLLAPALIPFGLAAITTVWLKWTLAAVLGTAALYSGYLFLTSTANEFMNLMTRTMNSFKKEEDLKAEDRVLSNHDVALLATMTLAGAGVVGLLYAMPSLLPALGSLPTVPKMVTAVTAGAVASVAGLSAIKGFFANRGYAAEQAKTLKAHQAEAYPDKSPEEIQAAEDEANPYLMKAPGK